MNLGTTAATLISALALLITVLLFAISRVLMRRDQRRVDRQALIKRVLDSFERTTRGLARPVFHAIWWNPDVEDILLAARLLGELPKKERVVGLWLQRQAQLAGREINRLSALKVRAAAVSKILTWAHGETPTRWFSEEVRRDPYEPHARLARGVKVRKSFRDARSWMGMLSILAAVALMLRQVWK